MFDSKQIAFFQVRDQVFKTIKGFLEKLEKVSEQPELIAEYEAQVKAGGKSGLLASEKVSDKTCASNVPLIIIIYTCLLVVSTHSKSASNISLQTCSESGGL